LHSIFGGKSASTSPSPSPPPPPAAVESKIESHETQQQQNRPPVGFYNDPSVPLASHLSPSTPHAPGAFKEDDDDSSKQLGYQDPTSTGGGAQGQSGRGNESSTRDRNFSTNAGDSQKIPREEGEAGTGTGKAITDENKSSRDGSNDNQPPPRVGFYNNPSIPLAAHLYSDDGETVGSKKKEDDSKQLGHEEASAAGKVQSQPDHESQPSTQDKSFLAPGVGDESPSKDKQEAGVVKLISEDKTSVPFGEKEVDFSSLAHRPNETAADLKSSQSPPMDVSGSSTASGVQDSDRERSHPGMYSHSTPIDQGERHSQTQAQEMPVDPNADKSLARNFGEMSMEESKMADKQPLLGIEDEVEKADLGGGDHPQSIPTSTSASPTARQLPTESSPSSHPISNEEARAGTTSDARLEPGFGSAGRDRSAPRQIQGAGPLATSQIHHESHLDAKRAGIKSHHSTPSSTRGLSTDESTAGEHGSLDEDGKKKPKKKVGLGDK
jgi:hypothetical protein